MGASRRHNTHLKVDGVLDDLVVGLELSSGGNLLVELAAETTVLRVLGLLDLLQNLVCMRAVRCCSDDTAENEKRLVTYHGMYIGAPNTRN